MKIGFFKNQKEGFKAFIPEPFPPDKGFEFSDSILQKAMTATLRLGKLDGITQLLPDVDFFIFMYIRKDAAASSQIEGTQATMIDTIEAESKTSVKLPGDVDDILHYIKALNYGITRLKNFPFSLRFIREIHKVLMKGARNTHFSDPGNFRASQNWIGGTKPSNASFVPPPVTEMKRALSDLEKFFYNNHAAFPIIKAGMVHAQFETIHPFLDGNGRTGRMLITFILNLEKLLDLPVLYLSNYFKQHQNIYYEKLNDYHNSKIESWLEFFLDGVIEVSEEAIETAKKITALREKDMLRIQSLNKTASESAMKILPKLFALPIVNIAKIQEWTGFSRQGAQKTINRFVELGILSQKNKTQKYGRSFAYKEYLTIFK